MEKIGPDHFRFYDEINRKGVTIHCERFVVVRETPRCWIVVPERVLGYAQTLPEWVKSKQRRVLKQAYRRYCYPNLADAMRSYQARKSWQIRHAKLALSRAEAGHAEAVRLNEIEGLTTGAFPHQCEGGEYIKGLHWTDW